MTNALETLLAKAAQEQDLRKRALSLRDEGDRLLDEMAQDKMIAEGLSYETAYDAVVKSDLGGSILKHREQAARFIEAEPSIN